MTKINLSFFIGFVLFSCKNNKSSLEEKNQWSEFQINIEKRYNGAINKRITVSLDEDTCYFGEIFKEDTVYLKQHGHFKSELKKFTLSKQERDTLFLCAERAIVKPVLTDRQVSDYAGEYVNISLYDGMCTKISCGYSSVLSWQISSTLNKINQLTFEKVESSR